MRPPRCLAGTLSLGASTCFPYQDPCGEARHWTNAFMLPVSQHENDSARETGACSTTDREHQQRTIERAGQLPESLEKIRDPELIAWLSGDDISARELVVEAALPQRAVSFTPRGSARLGPDSVTSDGAGREAVLEELLFFLQSILNKPPVLLKSAGALAIEASNAELRQVLSHPLVKAVRSNRKRR